jgi:hypothetical protein
MTDQTREPGRVDFHAFADDPQFGDVERVMRGVLEEHRASTSRSRRRQQYVFGVLATHARPLATAAAIVIALSLAALTLPGATSAAAPQQTLATWVQFNHIPTNGELLSTFQGYGR